MSFQIYSSVLLPTNTQMIEMEHESPEPESNSLSGEDNQTSKPIKAGHVPVYERVEGGCDAHVGWMSVEDYNKDKERWAKDEEEEHGAWSKDCLGGTCTLTPLGYRCWQLFFPCVPAC